MDRPLRLLLPMLMLAAACGRTDSATGAQRAAATPAGAGFDDAAVRLSEQRTGHLAEIARSMRDADPNLAWPLPDAFWAEVRRRHPGGDPAADPTLDGWNRPLHYVRGGDMRTYRLYSAGPNGRDEHGRVDDVALREGQTLIE